MSKLARTPKNISTGERIAEENQPLTCQNTEARKQDNKFNQKEIIETPARKPGQETQLHKMEPLNQPDDVMDPDEIEEDQKGTRCNTVILQHNIVEQSTQKKIEESELNNNKA